MTARKHMALRVCSWLFGASLYVGASSVAIAQSPPKNFVMHEAPKRVAEIAFEDDQGRARSLADFRGRVVLLNVWATWCVPCRHEMASLDRLQIALGGPQFEVVALSIDRSGIEAVRKFYAEIGIRNLAIYIDSSGRAPRDLGAVGIPVTFLIDRQGREIGRLMGTAEWDEPETVEFLKRVVSQKASDLEQPIRDKRRRTSPPFTMNQPGRPS